MDFEEYQRRARTTALYADRLRRLFPDQSAKGMKVELFYSAAGLCDEAGEVAGKVKKWLRGDIGDAPMPDKDDLKKELGDVLWYIAAICTDMGLSMNEVAEHNIAKLSSRKERGVLHGSGDNR